MRPPVVAFPPEGSISTRAKINLALHVTGQRADGYHELDTLVAFAGIGDNVAVKPTQTPDIALEVSGQFAADLGSCAEGDNLVTRAVRAVRDLAGVTSGAVLQLEKNLPVASGIGGGSCDAATAIRLACEAWGLDWQSAPVMALAASLGADVPMCLHRHLLRAQGIGDRITLLPPLPDHISILLFNPGIQLSTPAVFRALACKTNPPLPPVPQFRSPLGVAAFMDLTRNDLEAPAISLVPVIGDILHKMRGLDGALAARMSGSGATCFALFDGTGRANKAVSTMADAFSALKTSIWSACARYSY